ncbi:Rieske 2Fe-2S domain-containing protein [Curvibacter sp. APW13]|uniref:Rieske (2Fe-2S) protein n=1 Tax=Curvibacter sp. APW13 TaxID=3077236 RepID=UPI0028DEB5CA|nr:Rieske 2Fe-2S domain-containing protein [Curvibacter sp. APW13]MDT8992495.1 Rieske 2Fe-2S domain-containing protein [Curvibacter sp. APW13]
MNSIPSHWQQIPGAPSHGEILARLSDLDDGQARMGLWRSATATESTPAFPYLLLRSGNTVRAYVNRCAHFGVPLAQKQEHLKFMPHASITCNVHYARYDWQDGRCLGGDCDGEGLLAIPVEVGADGAIRIAAP